MRAEYCIAFITLLAIATLQSPVSSHKPYSDGNCFSGGRKWFSPYTGGSWWFNCRPNPGCQCFSLTTPVKIPGRITYCFLTNTRSCGNLIAVRIHISEFTRRNRFKIQCLITPEHRNVVLRCNLHIISEMLEKYLKEQYFMTAQPQRLGAEEEEKHKLSNGSLLWQQQVCNTILKCVL